MNSKTDFIPDYDKLRWCPSSKSKGTVRLIYRPRHFRYEAITDCRTDVTEEQS